MTTNTNAVLVAALEKIAAIENQMVGSDWEEIDDARAIARAALSTAAAQPPAGAFQLALAIRSAQGWTLDGGKVPVLYTDSINDEQVCRDDLWLCTTDALAAAPKAEPANSGSLTEFNKIMGLPAGEYPPLPGDAQLGLVQYTAIDVRAAIDADRAMRAQAAPHITQPYTLAEIKAKIASGSYSAELLLQHAMLLLEKPAAVAAPSPTAGMTLAQRILHVGGRNNAAGYVEFGSTQAVEALVRQVLRDMSAPTTQASPQPAVQQGDASPTMPKNIEMMATNRYRPVPSGVLAYKVVGGDGNRSLFSGTKGECQIVARKLTEAFLDGAHVALSTHPAAPAAQGDAEDAARLDFMIEHRAYVVSDPDACPGYWLHFVHKETGRTWVQGDEHTTPRAAIDAARSQAKGGA